MLVIKLNIEINVSDSKNCFQNLTYMYKLTIFVGKYESGDAASPKFYFFAPPIRKNILKRYFRRNIVLRDQETAIKKSKIRSYYCLSLYNEF